MKRLAKLSAREEPGVEVGNVEEDLRCSSLLTICDRRFGLSESEETKLEKILFFGSEDQSMVLVTKRFERRLM